MTERSGQTARSTPVATLKIQDLRVSFAAGGEPVDAVRGVSLTVRPGTTHAIVGESGSGKSVTMMSVLSLLTDDAHVSGSICFEGEELVGATEHRLRHVRGAEIGVVFQDPLSSLNPVMTVGNQIIEAMRAHRKTAPKASLAHAVSLLKEVGIPEAARRVKEYPHQFSGGMRQRVMIAMALAAEPRLLIADEATTALDVTVQAQILRLVRRITEERDMTTIWISHDLGVVAQIADDITVMRDGLVVEHGPCAEIFESPRSDYTVNLLRSMPRLDSPLRHLPEKPGSQAIPAIEAEAIEVGYTTRRGLFGKAGLVRAVDDVSLALAPGETLGLVGESGSGKSTLARALLGLEHAQHGTIRHNGVVTGATDRQGLRRLRETAQMVFQDPSSSMNPGLPIREVVTEALLINDTMNRKTRRARADELLELVELPAELADRFPYQLSGGQRQRVAIARALSMNPTLLVCDEPVSALDVSVQAQILDLLRRLQSSLGISLLVISHDLAVIRDIAHRVAVMYLGKIVEIGERDSLFSSPQHPYTRALLSAVPIPDPHRRIQAEALQGDPPSPLSPPRGCRFHTRCAYAVPGRCDTATPPLLTHAVGHEVACVRLGELDFADGWSASSARAATHRSRTVST